MAPATLISTTAAPASPTMPVIYLPILWEVSGARVPVDDLSRDSVISLLATGEFSGIIKVIASDTSTGKCWDASQEIAREALAQAVDRYGYQAVPVACMEFAEDQLGLNTTSAFCIAA